MNFLHKDLPLKRSIYKRYLDGTQGPGSWVSEHLAIVIFIMGVSIVTLDYYMIFRGYYKLLNICKIQI